MTPPAVGARCDDLAEAAGAPAPARRWLWWVGWIAVTFGAWNSCASHREARKNDALLASGRYPVTPGFALAAFRGAGTDDSDISRYLAYANAALGRPFQPYYVRPLEGWTAASEASGPAAADRDDPRQSPPQSAPGPLVPYRDFSVEYPPGFFLLALPPALLGLDLDGYRLAFSAWMALLLLAAMLAALDLGRTLCPRRPPEVLPTATLAALALGTIAVRRYDAVVSLSVCLFLLGCVRRWPVVAGLSLGVGVAAKVVPLMVLPAALVYWIALRRWRELLLAGAVALAVELAINLPLLVLAGGHLFDLLRYHGQRPLEVESTGAALLSLGRLVWPDSAHAVEAYGCSNVVGGADRVLLPLSGLLPAAAVLAIAAWSARRTAAVLRAPGGERAAGELLLRAGCATLAATMATGKVLSAQYPTWLLPAGALAAVIDDGGRRGTTSGLLIAAMVLTQLNQHLFFALLPGAHPLFGALVLLRNGLLLAFALRLLRGPAAEAAA